MIAATTLDKSKSACGPSLPQCSRLANRAQRQHHALAACNLAEESAESSIWDTRRWSVPEASGLAAKPDDPSFDGSNSYGRSGARPFRRAAEAHQDGLWPDRPHGGGGQRARKIDQRAWGERRERGGQVNVRSVPGRHHARHDTPRGRCCSPFTRPPAHGSPCLELLCDGCARLLIRALQTYRCESPGMRFSDRCFRILGILDKLPNARLLATLRAFALCRAVLRYLACEVPLRAYSILLVDGRLRVSSASRGRAKKLKRSGCNKWLIVAA